MTKNSFSLDYLAAHALDYLDKVLDCHDGCGDELKIHLGFHDALLLQELMKRVKYGQYTKLYNVVAQKVRNGPTPSGT